MISVGQIIYEAGERYPALNLISDITKAMRLTKIEQVVYKYIGKLTMKDITVTETKAYDISNDFRSDNLKRVLFYDQSKGSSATAGTPFNEVVDVDELKERENAQWLNLPYYGGNYTKATIFYVALPVAISTDANTWDTTYPAIEDEYSDVLLYGLIADSATFGDVPDIVVANNYRRLYEERLSQAKADYYHRKQKNHKNKISHEQSW